MVDPFIRPYQESGAYLLANGAGILAAPDEQLVGQLSSRTAHSFRGSEIDQARAWDTEVKILRRCIASNLPSAAAWGVLIEFPLTRLEKRIDAIILINDVVTVLEFKIGATTYDASAIQQVEDYAVSLREFHELSHDHRIVPILCADQAKTIESKGINFAGGIAAVLLVNSQTLADSLREVEQASNIGKPRIDSEDFDRSRYNPTPNIVRAAQAIYEGHDITEFGRTDSDGKALEATANYIARMASEARSSREHRICFVTGSPGSGKTLLGLDLVFSGEPGRVSGEPAALLSGNPPLIHVLREALTESAYRLKRQPKLAIRLRTKQAIQGLVNFLRDYTEAPEKAPPEHVVVYDEAQRAWNKDVGEKLLQRPESEPAIVLDILGRLPWACLVCLVGPGQEINRGEDGLQLWGKALKTPTSTNSRWRIYASSERIDDILGTEFENTPVNREEWGDIVAAPELHLANSMRSYRNETFGRWLDALLAADILRAREIADSMRNPPALLMRDLGQARAWLRTQIKGSVRVGLLCSSGATRLIAEGIPPSPRSDDLQSVANWFLKPTSDFRSSNSLEVPLTEFVCQGLELDYAGLCWGGDLVWSDVEGWIPRKMSSPNWRTLKNEDSRRFRINTYRVLMTRHRAGLAIYVPKGDPSDATRNPSEFDCIATVLEAAGCKAAQNYWRTPVGDFNPIRIATSIG